MSCALFATAALSVTSAVSAQKLPPELGDVPELLRGMSEEPVHRGAKKCLDTNSVDSVELLLGVMDREGRLTRNHFEAGHYRDLSFEYVIQFTDHYARLRVAEEVRKNRKNGFARQWAVEALGHFGGHDYGKSIDKGLSDKHDGVKRWAAWSAGKVQWPHSNKKLLKNTKDKDPFVRGNAFEALARIDPEVYSAPMMQAIADDDDGGVRCALLLAAAEILPDDVERLSIARIADPDWRTRLQAVENLAQVRSKAAVDTLIEALRDGRSLIARRALTGLQELTGEPIQQPDVWVKWWADNRETFTFPENRGQASEKREGQTVTFAGIPLDSDHVAFVLDKSYLMKERSRSARTSRDAAAQDELKKVLMELRGEMLFNVYCYDEEVSRMSKKPVALNDKTKRKALKFASAPAGGRYKDMWQVLEEVVSNPVIDTVYFISSGEADVGLYCHGNRIGRHLADLNRYHKTTVHAIAYTEQEGFRWHVAQVAEATGGTFKALD